VSRLSSDTGVIQDGLSTNVAMFIRAAIFVLVSFVFLFIISWQLTLTIVVSILPVIIYSIFYGNKMKKAQKIVQDKKAKISTLAEESFANIRTVKAFANEEEEARKFKIENDAVYEVGFSKAILIAFFNMVANFFFYGSMASILLVGGLLVQSGKLQIGDIASFMFYMIQILINFMMLAQVFG
jgi:ATP-binding cassette subfamily B (MDR/TAP) protein 9